MHCGHFHDVADCQNHRVVGHIAELVVICVDHRHHPVALHEDIGPVVSGVVVGDGVGETCVRIGHVACHRASEKALCELCGVHVRGDDTVRDSGEGSLDDVAVTLELVLGHAVRVAVDFQIVGRAGCRKRRGNG